MKPLVLSIITLVLLCGSCTVATVPPKVDLSERKVAILPFTTISKAEGLEMSLQVKVINKISSIPGINLIDEAIVRYNLTDPRLIILLTTGQGEEKDFLNFSERIKADIFILGGITSYQEMFQWDKPIRSGRLFKSKEKYWSVAQITTVRLAGILKVIEGKTGKIIFTVSENVDASDRHYFELPWDGENLNPPPPKLYGFFDTSRVVEAREMAISRLAESLTKHFFYRKELR